MKRIKILSFTSIVLVGMVFIMLVPLGKLRKVFITNAHAVSLASRDDPTRPRFAYDYRSRFAHCKLNKAS